MRSRSIKNTCRSGQFDFIKNTLFARTSVIPRLEGRIVCSTQTPPARLAYSWLKVEAENSLWQDRIRKAVNAELSAKGWQNVSTGGNAALAAVGSVKTE